MNQEIDNDYTIYDSYEPYDDEPEEIEYDVDDDLDEERAEWANSWTHRDYSGAHGEYEKNEDPGPDMDNFDTYEEYSKYIDREEESRDRHEMSARGM